MLQPLQRFPSLTFGAIHSASGIIAVANEGIVFAFSLSLSTKMQIPVMLAKRASACVGMCFTGISGRLAVAHQDGFIYMYKVEPGSNNMYPRVCCVCAHDAPLVALCSVPQTDDVAAADESGDCSSRPLHLPGFSLRLNATLQDNNVYLCCVDVSIQTATCCILTNRSLQGACGDGKRRSWKCQRPTKNYKIASNLLQPPACFLPSQLIKNCIVYLIIDVDNDSISICVCIFEKM